jgi:NADP-dependent 3-hydroxy acid dehydrogenase YdfG
MARSCSPGRSLGRVMRDRGLEFRLDAGSRGKVVAITGARSGIGEASALLHAERGAKIVLGARRSDRLDSFVKRIAGAFAIEQPADVDVNEIVIRPAA